MKGFGKDNTITVYIVDDMKKTESSNIKSVSYQENTKNTYIEFKNGSLYQYKNVEKEDYEKLKNAESVGKHLQAVFKKNNYEYEKLENAEISYPVLTEEVFEEVLDVFMNKQPERNIE